MTNTATANDVVVELDELICSLDDDRIKEMFIRQIRYSIEMFRELSENDKKQN